MKTIYKYPLPYEDIVILQLPYGAKILSVLNQHEKIVLYALIDTEKPKHQLVKIRIVGTGHPLEENIKDYQFIGSVALSNQNLIFHVFADSAY
jgi:hypothetical protein